LSAAESDWSMPTGVASEVLQKCKVEHGMGKVEWERIGVCGRSTEDKGVEQKTKEGAGEGRKVVEASRMRLEAAGEVVDAKQARESELKVPGQSEDGRQRHGVVINNHNFWKSQRRQKT